MSVLLRNYMLLVSPVLQAITVGYVCTIKKL
jgi:hypothetical protein